MPQFSQKYVIAQFIESISDSAVFSMENWPLHVTVASVFAVDYTQTFLDELCMLLESTTPFSVKPGSNALFGPDHTIPVTLVKASRELNALHKNISEIIFRHGGAYNQPEYTGKSYRPHITNQDHATTKNHQVMFTRLSIIDMFPGGDHTQRKVLMTLPLGT